MCPVFAFVKYGKNLFIGVGDIHPDGQNFQIFCHFKQKVGHFEIWMFRNLAVSMAMRQGINLDKIENLGSTSWAHLIFQKKKYIFYQFQQTKMTISRPFWNFNVPKLGWRHGTELRNRFGQHRKFGQHLPGTFDFSKKMKVNLWLKHRKQN